MPANEKDIIFQSLVEEHGDSILRLCYLYLRDYYLAEDAAQNTFMKVYRNMDNFRNEASVKTWITKIAVNECKNQIRTSWFQKERNEMPDNLPGVEFEEDSEQKETMTEKIQNLPQKYREVILLYYFEELKVKEIAEILKIKEAAVLQRLKRGREKLKCELEGDGLYE